MPSRHMHHEPHLRVHLLRARRLAHIHQTDHHRRARFLLAEVHLVAEAAGDFLVEEVLVHKCEARPGTPVKASMLTAL